MSQAYELKSNSVLLLKGDKEVKLPIDYYLDGFINYKAFTRILSLTVPNSENYVRGYDFMINCVWPIFSDTLVKQMPFIFSLSSLPLFHANYLKLIRFLELQNLQSEASNLLS